MGNEPTHEETLRRAEDTIQHIEALIKKQAEGMHRLRNLLMGRKDDGDK